MSTFAEPRVPIRQRVPQMPQVDLTHSAAAGQLVVTVHVDVPDGFTLPDGFKASIAKAVQGVVSVSKSARKP